MRHSNKMSVIVRIALIATLPAAVCQTLANALMGGGEDGCVQYAAVTIALFASWVVVWVLCSMVMTIAYRYILSDTALTNETA